VRSPCLGAVCVGARNSTSIQPCQSINAAFQICCKVPVVKDLRESERAAGDEKLVLPIICACTLKAAAAGMFVCAVVVRPAPPSPEREMDLSQMWTRWCKAHMTKTSTSCTHIHGCVDGLHEMSAPLYSPRD
jgi:hypothetical protein